MYSLAVFDCFRHESAVLNCLLDCGVIGVEIEILFKKILIVAHNRIFATLVLYARHMIFCAHLESVSVFYEAENLPAIEGLFYVKSRRFGD